MLACDIQVGKQSMTLQGMVSRRCVLVPETFGGGVGGGGPLERLGYTCQCSTLTQKQRRSTVLCLERLVSFLAWERNPYAVCEPQVCGQGGCLVVVGTGTWSI